MAQFSRGLCLVFKRFKVTHIPAYKTAGSSLFPGNQVPANQKYFKIRGNDQFVYLRGSNDATVYKGLMTYAFIGVGLTFFGLYQMATGTMKKKERS